jgi:signal recognition particle GTPase
MWSSARRSERRKPSWQIALLYWLIMVMGKGGLGTTTVAAALAMGLVQCSNSVHLIATDPAAHRAER